MSPSTGSGNVSGSGNPSIGSGNFVRACAVSEVGAECALAVEVGDEDIAIVQSEGRFYAVADECSHASIPLSEGDVGDGELECYLHGSRFDLRTGRPTGLPATEPVEIFACKVEGDDILVDVSRPLDPDTAPQHAFSSANQETQES